MPNQSTTLQSIIGDIPEVYKNKTYKFKLHRTLLILICDTISALAQTSIFYFSCNYNAYGELSLNYYAIYLGTPAFFVSNFAAIHICGKFFYKDIFEGDNNLRTRYRKTTLFQILIVLVIGAFMGLVIHFIFWIYDVSRNFISSLDPAIVENTNYFFPTFSSKSANKLATIICSFMMLYTSLFSMFINQKHCQFIFVLKDNLPNSQIMKIMWHTFITKNAKGILSNLIIASILLTNTVSDYISLLFIVASGGIAGDGAI